jgi:hypothetical protein
MAFSNTFDTTNPGSAVSNREDLLDVLTILAPEETPVLSSAPKSKASATFVEWTVDSLSAPVTTGVAEGADVTAFTDKFAGRARLGNYVQKFRRDFMVSDLQNAVDSVGPAKIAQAEAKAVREIKRDIEATLMSTNDRSVEDGGSTVYGLRGLGDWIDSAGPADVPAAYRTPAASISASGAVTETVFNNLITSIYRVTGTTNSLTLVADTALRRVISDYARTSGSSDYSVRQVTYNGEVSSIKLAVEMYESDHGMVSIVNMNPDCAPDTTNKDTGYLINPDYYGVAELISLGSTRLPNLGGGDRGYVDSTLTLLVKHPGAHGKITAIA